MTFPSLGGNLTDPWVDGALVNAAAMKTNTTDKLNALADSLLVKTARVQAKFNCSNSTPASNTPTLITASSITAQTGGTFSIVSGRIAVPSPGVYNVRLSGGYTNPTPGGASIMRNYVLGYPNAAASQQDWAFFGYVGPQENNFVFAGLCELLAADLSVGFQVYQNSGSSQPITGIKGVITKVSD